jgi:hypothetical protein
MARYVVQGEAGKGPPKEPYSFDELSLANGFAQSFPPGTLVLLMDTHANEPECRTFITSEGKSC